MTDPLTFVENVVAPKASLAFTAWLDLNEMKKQAVARKASLSEILHIHNRMKEIKRRVDALQEQQFAVKSKLKKDFVAAKRTDEFYMWLSARSICADDEKVDEYFQQFREEK